VRQAPLHGGTGTPEDIARVVTFLAPPASSFTGTEILADGSQVLRAARGAPQT
jgi:NAD(P)-dependent dehydrogenase (short-subunit alcohol dehydrogenase family)